MVLQTLIDAHAAKIEVLAGEFQKQVEDQVELVVGVMTSYIHRSLSIKDSVVEQTRANVLMIRGIEDIFNRALSMSGYYSVMQAFVATFADQIDEFRTFYDELQVQFGLPAMILTTDDRAVLVEQAGAAVAALESAVLTSSYSIRQLTARSLGGIEVDILVQGVTDIIRKLSNVVPMAKDQLIVFFRLVGSLVYKNVEAAGYKVRYTYVGPSDEKVRDFCANLVDSNANYSRAEIDDMDNGQVPGVFENGGGYNCRHWFEMVRV